MNKRKNLEQLNRGTIISIRGSVIDARFPRQLPAIYNQLNTGSGDEIVIETLNHLDDETVRGVALTPTRGLERGAAVVDTGSPIRVPIGNRVLGRVFNVFGETIDRQNAPRSGKMRSA